MATKYTQGVSNRDLDCSGGINNDVTDKLMSVGAKENPDMVTGTNKLVQYENGSVKGKFGDLGVRGKKF